MIAALFVEDGGAYFGIDGVDPWPESRDARKYPGPYPVVAHPPCGSWCLLAGLREATHGYPKGEDGGCFESALESVRRYGGVLEHPAYTDAWLEYGLTPPLPGNPWQKTIDGGWVVEVEQGRYGHAVRKRTWLYAYGVDDLPSVDILRSPKTAYDGVAWAVDRRIRPDARKLGKKETKATPERFKALLLEIARNVG